MTKERESFRTPLVTAAIASAVAILPVILRVSFSTVPTLFGDGSAYLDVAQSLASGHGYTEPHGPWGSAPDIRRLPGWPLVVSATLRLVPRVNPVLLTRLTAAAALGAAAFAASLIAWRLSYSVRRMILAAVLTALCPEAVQYVLAGISEPFSAAILAVGTLMLCAGWWWSGLVVLSLMPLVRGYFLLFPLCACAALAFLWLRQRSTIPANWMRLAVSAVLFLIPSAIWMARNYSVSGALVLTAVDGEALYGSYNPLSATPGPHFGAFTFPGDLPGQEPFKVLGARMSQIELDKFWTAKGWETIHQHWRELPLMVATRLIRMLLPQRHNIGYYDRYIYVEWFFRSAIFLLAAFQLKHLGETGVFGIVLIASCIAILSSQLMWVGEDRYLYQATVLLVPFVCAVTGFGHQHFPIEE